MGYGRVQFVVCVVNLACLWPVQRMCSSDISLAIHYTVDIDREATKYVPAT
jgi:hypothetical protein